MTEAALLAAIVAHPDEDTPRLVYADWLDEAGDPARAAFIRTQIALANGHPADPDHPDLIEHHAELTAALAPRLGELVPPLLAPLTAPAAFGRPDTEPFRRGFPYFARWNLRTATPPDVRAGAAALDRMTTATTLRGLVLDDVAPAVAGDILQLPAVARLDALAVFPLLSGFVPEDSTAEAVAFSGAAPGLRRLGLHFGVREAGTNALAVAPFDALTDLAGPACYDAVTAPLLVDAPWFGRLRRCQVRYGNPGPYRVLVEGLARVPDLHTLDLGDPFPHSLDALTVPGGFPSLGRFAMTGRRPNTAAVLARCAFPRLAALALPGAGLGDGGLTILTHAPWFGQLRELDLTRNEIGDAGIAALADSPAARGLRILNLRDNPFGQAGLVALVAQNAFASLTTLDIGISGQTHGSPVNVAAVLDGFWTHRLRHLSLDGRPIGDAGAKAVAACPALAGLTRLSLRNCLIGEVGAAALFASPHLQGLVELDLGQNGVYGAVVALADPAVLPALGVLGLCDARVADADAARLASARPALFPGGPPATHPAPPRRM